MSIEELWVLVAMFVLLVAVVMSGAYIDAYKERTAVLVKKEEKKKP